MRKSTEGASALSASASLTLSQTIKVVTPQEKKAYSKTGNPFTDREYLISLISLLALLAGAYGFFQFRKRKEDELQNPRIKVALPSEDD